MPVNGSRIQSDSERSPYQKEIETIDNVILCVATAERMVLDVGRAMIEGMELPPKTAANGSRSKSFIWSGRRYSVR